MWFPYSWFSRILSIQHVEGQAYNAFIITTLLIHYSGFNTHIRRKVLMHLYVCLCVFMRLCVTCVSLYKIQVWDNVGKHASFFFHFQCSVSWFWCCPFHRKHLACDARFIMGTIIKSITDEPNTRVRDEGKKYREMEKKENRQQSEISQLDDIRKNQHHCRPLESFCI